MADLYTLSTDDEVYNALTWREATVLIRQLHARGEYTWVLTHYHGE